MLMPDRPKKSAQLGFTLAEMIVSVFILALLASIIIANYRAGQKQVNLQNAVNQLASDLRLAQNYTLAGKEEASGNFPQGGWGIHLANGSNAYILFADSNGNYAYDAGEGFKTLALPAKTNINALTVGGSDSSPLDIVFEPPDPTTYIAGLANNNEAEITLQEADSGQTKKISVNCFGLIEIE